jgi:hypothetical protein
MTKLLQVTISGSYRNSKKENIDFENVTGVIPFIDHDLAMMHVRDRYAHVWIKAATNADGSKKYPERVEDTRQVFIDDIKEIEGDQLSFVGKDIKDMSFEEMQDLATANDLRTVPLPKEISGVSLREMRIYAYDAYSMRFFKHDIGKDKEGFNFASLPPLVVGGTVSRDVSGKITNEEILEQEQKAAPVGSTLRTTMSMDDLKGIAKMKNISYPVDISFDALYSLLYGGSAPAAA